MATGRKFTETQLTALRAALDKKGAIFGRRGNMMGGAYRRMCERLADDGYVSVRPPFAITKKGLSALKDLAEMNFNRRGCDANRAELERLTAALEGFVDMDEKEPTPELEEITGSIAYELGETFKNHGVKVECIEGMGDIEIKFPDGTVFKIDVAEM